jgi:CheY-like chemotaxis protein
MANILIVDDEPSLLKANGRYFKAIGHTVNLANDGLEALCILERDSGIDILFIDYNMPEMNGFELATRIQSDEKYASYSKVPIIGIGDFPENKRSPLTAYVPKNLGAEELAKCIETYCRH